MPSGRYQHGDTVEAFSCAPGPMGWRYHSTAADVVCDIGFRMLRVRLPRLEGEIVGARLDDGTAVLRWPGPETEPDRLVVADALVTDSAGTWVALLRGVAAPGADPVEATVAVSPDGAPAEPWTVGRVDSWPEDGPEQLQLWVEEWHVRSPGRSDRQVYLTGDVLLWGSALLGESPLELTHLDGSPGQLLGRGES